MALQDIFSDCMGKQPVCLRAIGVRLGALVAIIIILQIEFAGCSERGSSLASLEPLGSSTHEFGGCHQGDVLAHEFRLANRGSVPIKILQVVSSCGCLVAPGDSDLGREPVPPQGTVSIPVEFTIGAVENVATASVTISYCPTSESMGAKDCAQREINKLSLLLRAEVIPDFRVSPSELDFGEIDGLSRQRVNGVIHVEPDAMREIELGNVRSSGDNIVAKAQPTLRNTKVRDVTVMLDASRLTSSQDILGYVVIETNSIRVPKAFVPVRASYRSAVSIQPDTIEIGSDVKGKVQKQIRIVTSARSQIRKVDAERALVGIEFDDRQQSKEHLATLTISPCTTDPLDTTVKIEIELFPENSQSAVREVSVPIYRFYLKKELQGDKS